MTVGRWSGSDIKREIKLIAHRALQKTTPAAENEKHELKLFKSTLALHQQFKTSAPQKAVGN